MKIQATIAGFQGEAVSLLANLDENTGVLVIVKTVKYREARAASDVALVSNLDLPDLDYRFTDKELRESIRAYYTRKAQLTLDLMNDVRRYEPDNKIQMESVDEGGRRYQVAPDINNGQVAVLAIIAMVETQSGFKAAMEASEDLIDLYRVHSI